MQLASFCLISLLEALFNYTILEQYHLIYTKNNVTYNDP